MTILTTMAPPVPQQKHAVTQAPPKALAALLTELAHRGGQDPHLIDMYLDEWVFAAMDHLHARFLSLFQKHWPEECDVECAERDLREYVANWASGHRREHPVGRKPTWPWPLTDVNPGVRNGPISFAHDKSALGRCGYKVGFTDGMKADARAQFLQYFFEHELPDEVIAVHGSEYGAPRSAQRLQKMANVIAANCRIRKKDNPHRYRFAIADWEDDLAYLKVRYYDDQLCFQWPATGVGKKPAQSNRSVHSQRKPNASGKKAAPHGQSRRGETTCVKTMSEHDLVRSINHGTVNDGDLVGRESWRYICKVRGRNLNSIDPVAWQALCAKRGGLYGGSFPRGY
jgi:hypothetical protein